MHYLIDENNPDSYVACQLCGKKFRKIYWDHFGNVHGVTLHEYRTIFPGPIKCRELLGSIPVNENDPDSYVTCQLCGVKFKILAWSHVLAHGVTSTEYRAVFPGPTKSKLVLKRYAKSIREAFSDPEALAARNTAISLAHQTRIITDEETERRRAAGRISGYALWDRLDADPERKKEYLEKRSESCKNSELYRETHAAVLDEVRPTPEESSRTMTENIQNGTIHPQYRSVPTDYDGITFRSRLEASFAELFDNLGWDWDYEPEILTLEDGKSYLPDFRVKELGGFVEVKGYDDGWNTRKANEVGARVLLPSDLRSMAA